MYMSVRELLAEYAHDAWSGWMRYVFKQCGRHAGPSVSSDTGEEHYTPGVPAVIPAWAKDRWMRQMETPYVDLSEEEKESDRAEADKILEIVDYLQQAITDIHYMAKYSNRTELQGAAECLKSIQAGAENVIPELRDR